MEQKASEQIPHMSPDEFVALGHRMVDWIADYWRQVEWHPVLSRVKPGEVLGGLPLHAPPQGGQGWDAIFRDLDEIIMPGITHWQSPNFFAYFPANASGPGVLGELLSRGVRGAGDVVGDEPGVHGA